MKTKKSGTTTVVCHHPIHAEIFCELSIQWRVRENFEILKETILTFCDQRAHDDEPIPDWVDYEKIEQEILDYELD